MVSRSSRRRAREQALMMLFGIDMAKQRPDAALEAFYGPLADGPLDPAPAWDPYSGPGYEVATDSEVREFAEKLVRGVSNHQEALDQAIQKISHHWRMSRMAIVDRNVLRLGAFELLHPAEDVPRKVALNEAVELAKTFGTADSGAFVNGILDRLSK